MPRVHDGAVGELRQAVDEAVIHGGRVAAGKVRPPATLEEERVAGDEAAVDEEALTARGVSGGVQETDGNLSDLEHIVTFVAHEACPPDTGRPLDPGDLIALDVDRDLDQLEEIGDARDVVAEQVAADVIGVVVGGEHAGEAHPFAPRGCRSPRPAHRPDRRRRPRVSQRSPIR